MHVTGSDGAERAFRASGSGVCRGRPAAYRGHAGQHPPGARTRRGRPRVQGGRAATQGEQARDRSKLLMTSDSTVDLAEQHTSAVLALLRNTKLSSVSFVPTTCSSLLLQHHNAKSQLCEGAHLARPASMLSMQLVDCLFRSPSRCSVENVAGWHVGACTQALEERFHQIIEPAVSSALAARQADRMASLAALMTNLGRENELDGLYVAARLPMLQVEHLIPSGVILRCLGSFDGLQKGWKVQIVLCLPAVCTPRVLFCLRLHAPLASVNAAREGVSKQRVARSTIYCKQKSYFDRPCTLQGLWDGFEGRGFASWLPTFYEGVASAVSTESKWCSKALPDLHPRLVLLLLSALFSRIDKPLRTRLASALVQGTPTNL